MSHGSGLSHAHHVVGHRKTVPPGSDLYEQVLDDLRHDSDLLPDVVSPSLNSSSSSSPLPSSSSSSSSCERCQCIIEVEQQGGARRVRVEGEALELDEDHGSGQGADRDVWLRALAVCSCGTAVTGLREGIGEGENACGSEDDGCSRQKPCPCQVLGKGCAPQAGPGRHVHQQHTSDMGHTSSLLLHRRHRHYAAHEDSPGHHTRHHHHHQSEQSEHTSHSRRCSSLPSSPFLHTDKGKQTSSTNGGLVSNDANAPAGRSLSLPPTAGSHSVSWTESSGVCQGQSKFFTNSDDPEDTGPQSGRPHPPLSRLYPRVPAGQSQRRSSPSPNRSALGSRRDTRGRPGTSCSPSGDRARKQELIAEDLDRSPAPRSASPASSLRRREARFPDINHAGNRMCSSPLSQRRSEPTGSASIGSPAFLPLPSPAPKLRSGSPIRLYVYDVDADVNDCNGGGKGDETLLGSDPFRPRSLSDVSMQMQRRGQMPRLPLLRPSGEVEEDRAGGEDGEDVDHAHVHWADEEGRSPLATSVLLSKIRPRALSHGSADLPHKPILKKHNGF